MSSNCLACTDPINACPTCPAGQSCIQTGRTCSACPKRICQDTGSSSTKGGGGGTSTGATAGGAVGGVVGVAVLLAAVYFFWWRPRGLAASRKRYSKHLSHRQSKLADKRKSQLAPGETDVATKRSSVHLHIDTAGGDGVNRRNTSPGAAREGGALTPGRTSEDDNPFGDQNRSSIGDFDDANSIHTSDFSFRSSHTNVIPIAYIPPHSSSMSIADGQRGAFGESPSSRDRERDHDRDSHAPPPPRSAQGIRASIPTSMASRDSLALAGAEIIELHPLPPVLTPDTPAVPHGTLANGAPIRPPRSPGLDLKLPNTPKVSSPLAGGSPSSPTRPTSGGVFPPVLPPSSGSPGSSPNLSFLSTSPTGGRGMSVLGDPRSRSAQSHMSTMTSRSATSTMSYILDPPQIITPLSAQGVRRVELQKGQAGLVHIGGAGGTALAHDASATSPTSPTGSVDPFDDSNRSSLRHSRLGSQGTVTPGGDARSETPLRSRPGSSATDTSRWTTGSALSDDGSVQFLQGQTVTFTNPNTPSALGGGGGAKSPRLPHTASGASFDVPQSARSSEAFDTGSQVRPLTGTMSAWSSSPGVSPSSSMGTVRAAAGSGARTSTPMTLSGSRDSTASGMSDGSLLEGIPFLAPSTSSAGATAGTRAASTSSVSLGLPVNVTAPIDSSAASTSSASVRAPSIVDGQDQDDDPLPAPFLPFAGQRPTSSKPAPSSSSAGATAGTGSERVQSAAISVRSGFGSGLSHIPFQLGFPSGFGDDGSTEAGDDDDDLDERDRRSMMSAGGESTMGGVPRSENGAGSVRQSYASSMTGEDDADDGDDEQVVLVQAERAVVAPVAPAPAAQTAPQSAAAPPPIDDDASNPFGTHAELPASANSSTADPRASMDSLALAMGLAANLDAEASSRA
ncbi:hypothetical protein JCM8208_007441 [Rhodotorula glutinis]